MKTYFRFTVPFIFFAGKRRTNMSNIGYTSVNLMEGDGRFSKPLRPVTTVAFFFGASAIFESPVSLLSAVVFYILFAFMLGVASIGIFLRTDIDIWIQFSLYVVPIITILCCHAFFNSIAFRELLYRCLPSRAMLCSSIPNDVFTSASQLADAQFSTVSQKRKWLRNMAYKACLYPIFYQLIQWSSYTIFQLQFNDSHNFAGNDNISKTIPDKYWLIFYAIFWTVGLYFVGMFTFQYILITYIIRRDAISFMSLFGDSPFLFVKKSLTVYRSGKDRSFFFALMRFLSGVVFMDAVEDNDDITDFHGYYSSRGSSRKPPLSRIVPARSYDRGTPALDEHFHPIETENSSEEQPKQITGEEASKMLAHFITDVSDITSYFTPFTTALLFFSITNLVTHLCIFALKRSKTEDQYIWTLVRTVIWLLMTVRIVVAAARVTNTLGKIEPHVKYLRAAGCLYGDDFKWENFLALAGHFKLGEQSFGFPLTLKQIGILVALLKMTFLVILSVLKVPGLDLV